MSIQDRQATDGIPRWCLFHTSAQDRRKSGSFPCPGVVYYTSAQDRRGAIGIKGDMSFTRQYKTDVKRVEFLVVCLLNVSTRQRKASGIPGGMSFKRQHKTDVNRMVSWAACLSHVKHKTNRN